MDATANDFFDAAIVEVDATAATGPGGYAYAVLDESTKARIDLVPGTNPHGEAGMQAKLGEAVRFTPLEEGFAKALAPFKESFA